ncbi:GL27012 [Drosophila persimilis]|uniref:GL27012 n=1 Tax=Drosophila persimilis TaxID=7234 RepID=B4H7F1_DROPE|nr:GL27012 [Drosophila persimilis]
MLPCCCGELAAAAVGPTCCGSRCRLRATEGANNGASASVLHEGYEARDTPRTVSSVSVLGGSLPTFFLAYFSTPLCSSVSRRVASARLLQARADSSDQQGRIRGDPRDSLTIGTFYRYLRQLLSALAPLATDAVLQLNGTYAAQELYGGSPGGLGGGGSGSGSGSGMAEQDVSISGIDLYNYSYNYTGNGLEFALEADGLGSRPGFGLLSSTLSAPTANAAAPSSNHSHRSGGVAKVSADVPIWVIPCYSIILLCAVVGNLLVVLTLVQNRRMRTITNVFLLNLAISDILLGVFCMPVTLVGTLLRHFIFGEFLCKLIQFAQAASVAVSSWTLVAISCERYYAICHPLRSRTWQTINHANKIIAIIWLGSLLCMTPIALFSQLMPTSRPGLRKCREQWPADSLNYERAYNLFLDLALLVLPLLALSFTYLFITRTLYVSMRNERAMNFGSSGPESKKRVVKMLFVLVLEFFICWTPLYVINTMTMLIGPVVYEYVDYTAISFLQLLAYSSSCCNPITYCFMNASFRRAFVDTFKVRMCDGGRLCFWRRRSKNETNLSVAGNSIALANSVMSSHTILESPRL